MARFIIKGIASLIIGGVLLSSCDTMSNTSKGYVAGTIGGTILGAGLGAVIGGDRGADIGAHLGMAVGGVTGAAIGAEQDEKAYKESTSQSYQENTNEGSSNYYDKNTGLTYTKVSEDNSILFASRSSMLNDKSCTEIIRIFANLRGKSFTGIVIYGSTDDMESRDYSEELSRERAEVVASYLIDLGVNRDIISIVGLGKGYPVADNSTLSGRAKNRCVDVYVVTRK